MARYIDLNADIGELEGEEGRASDDAILSAVTSCNIACGGHAGDEVSMRETIRLACLHGVKIGAHPSYPDREGFGRRSLGIDAHSLKESLSAQIGRLMQIAGEMGAHIDHVKPHGALYNEAAKDGDLAKLIVDIVVAKGIPVLFGPSNSELQFASETAGLRFIAEGFVDRAYERDGSLTPRTEQGAVLEDASRQIAQAKSLAAGKVRSRTGSMIDLPAQTLCLHGDTANARLTAGRIRSELEALGFEIGIEP